MLVASSATCSTVSIATSFSAQLGQGLEEGRVEDVALQQCLTLTGPAVQYRSRLHSRLGLLDIRCCRV